MIELDVSDDGRSLHAALNDMLVVSLPENPLTGYRWQMGGDGAPVCVFVSDTYAPPADSKMGAGSVHRWQFQARQVGVAEIHLQQRRPWETNQAAAKSFHVRIEVDPKTTPEKQP